METFMQTPVSTTALGQEGTFAEEFEHEPVPLQRRHSLKSVTAVWVGFPMVLTQAVFGGIIVYNLGFIEGASAILLGNLVLCLYVGALSYVAGSTGLNFAMQAKKTFGSKGYSVACGLLSTLVVGWYAFQTGLTGATIHTAFGWNMTAVIVVATLLYTATTFLGIRALAIVGMMAPTLFIIMGLIALVLASLKSGMADVWHFKGLAHGMTFGGAISLVIAGFADAGTMTADFTRWSRNGREGVLASLSAFPLANGFAFLFGGVIVAAGAAINPAHNGGDFMPLLTGHGVLLTALALVFVFVNLGSVCAHCLYNGAVGYSHLLKNRMRVLTLVLGILGGIAAILGIWSLFPYWLSLLGIFVPPIGAVMIMDQLILGQAARLRAEADFHPRAFAAWAMGSAVAIVFHIWMPQYGEALAGLLVSGAAYAALGLGQPSREAALDTIT
jgi:cytosine permease